MVWMLYSLYRNSYQRLRKVMVKSTRNNQQETSNCQPSTNLNNWGWQGRGSENNFCKQSRTDNSRLTFVTFNVNVQNNYVFGIIKRRSIINFHALKMASLRSICKNRQLRFFVPNFSRSYYLYSPEPFHPLPDRYPSKKTADEAVQVIQSGKYMLEGTGG